VGCSAVKVSTVVMSLRALLVPGVRRLAGLLGLTFVSLSGFQLVRNACAEANSGVLARFG
jgi:hypothetical protein